VVFFKRVLLCNFLSMGTAYTGVELHQRGKELEEQLIAQYSIQSTAKKSLQEILSKQMNDVCLVAKNLVAALL
jgi:hypothetical protein